MIFLFVLKKTNTKKQFISRATYRNLSKVNKYLKLNNFISATNYKNKNSIIKYFNLYVERFDINKEAYKFENRFIHMINVKCINLQIKNYYKVFCMKIKCM